MESLGGGGVAVAILGLVGAIAGLVVVVVGVRDARRRISGMRAVFVGIAIASLGLGLFTLSRPSSKLPPPFNIVFALVFSAVAVRMGVAAVARSYRPKD